MMKWGAVAGKTVPIALVAPLMMGVFNGCAGPRLLDKYDETIQDHGIVVLRLIESAQWTGYKAPPRPAGNNLYEFTLAFKSTDGRKAVVTADPNTLSPQPAYADFLSKGTWTLKGWTAETSQGYGHGGLSDEELDELGIPRAFEIAAGQVHCLGQFHINVQGRTFFKGSGVTLEYQKNEQTCRQALTEFSDMLASGNSYTSPPMHLSSQNRWHPAFVAKIKEAAGGPGGALSYTKPSPAIRPEPRRPDPPSVEAPREEEESDEEPLEDDWKARQAAVAKLAKTGGPEALVSLIKAMEDEHERVRGTAARGLGKSRSNKAIKPLLKALKDESPFVRASAALAFRDFGDERAVKHLTLLLKDADPGVRKAAGQAVKALKAAVAAQATE